MKAAQIPMTRDRAVSPELVRTPRLEVLSLCVGNALSACAFGTMPLWVAAITKEGLLPLSGVGWLASGELLAIAMGILLVSAAGRRAGPRRVVVTAAYVAVMANVIAMLPLLQTVVIGRLVSGVAVGAMAGAITGVVARGRDAVRLLALIQVASVLLISGVDIISPTLILRFGPAGHFALLASIGAVAAITASMSFPAVIPAAPAASRVTGAATLAPTLGCLALSSIFLGFNTVVIYVIPIGNSLGIDSGTIGVFLGVVTPFALLGPIAARWVGERTGLMRPLLLGLVFVAVDVFFLVDAYSRAIFYLCPATTGMLIEFCVPYAITLLARLDASGRSPSAAPAFIMFGAAAGPAVGGKLAGASHFQTLAVVATSCVALGIVLFVAAARLHASNVSFRRLIFAPKSH